MHTAFFLILFFAGTFSQTSQPAAAALTPDERRQLNDDKQALGRQRKAIATGLNCDGCAGRGVATAIKGGSAYGKGTKAQGQVKCKLCSGDGLTIDNKLISALQSYLKRRDELEREWVGVQIEGRPTLAEWMLRRVTTGLTVSKFTSLTADKRAAGDVFCYIVEPTAYYDNRQCDFTIVRCNVVRDDKVTRRVETLVFVDGAPREVPRMIEANRPPRVLVIGYFPEGHRLKSWSDQKLAKMSADPLDPLSDLKPTGDESLWRGAGAARSSYGHVLAAKMVSPTTLKRIQN